MNHSFDTQTAAEYGVFEAIMIENLKHWIAKNKANEKHFYEGRTWTYNSVKAFSIIFHYLTPKQIRTSLENLRTRGVIIAGNFNENKYDQTKWYAFVDEDRWICPNGQMGLPKKTNEVAQEGKTFKGTDINPNINPNINSLSVPDSLSPLDEEESKLSSPPEPNRKPKPSTYGINNQQVMEAYDAMRKWLNLPDYEYPPSSATFLWKKIQNNCKQILQSVGNPTKDGGDNMTSVKKYLLSVADMYKKGLFPFDSQESIGIDRIGSAGIIPYVLNYVPTKVIKQCAFGDSKVNPKYVKDFKGKWHEVKRWGNNVAYTVSGQEIQVSIAEKTAMMRYEGDITF